MVTITKAEKNTFRTRIAGICISLVAGCLPKRFGDARKTTVRRT
jgi:hypothetical protein